MESFATLKRRTTEILQSIPQNLPSMPNVGANTNTKKEPAAMNGTWERIDIPPLPRSSHSINIINGSAYIFGGDAQPGQPADNDMHVITLPYNSAGADYYRVKAAPPKVYSPPAEPESEPKTEAKQSSEQESTSEEKVTDESKAATQTEKGLDEIPLASPPPVMQGASQDDEEDEAEDDDDDPELTPTTTSPSRKGKQREEHPSPATFLPPVPPPRAGHATATLGHRILLFGGRDPSTSKPLNEYGRVWVFDTRTNSWTFLDPVPPAPGVTLSPTPAPRHGHAATSIDRPRPWASRGVKRAQSWKQWVQGDSAEVGIPQAPIVGNLALNATDEDDEGYGTMFVHAGLSAPVSVSASVAGVEGEVEAKPTNDLWAFDVNSRIWTEFPAAPGPGRVGTSLAISKSRLFRFGGFDGEVSLGGQLDFVHLEVESFDDGFSRGEVGVQARGGWQSIVAGASAGEDEIPLVAAQEWPLPRAFSGLEAVTSGAGREYLVLVAGEATDGGAAEGRGREGTSTIRCNDSWVFQVPPLGMTTTSFRDAMWQAMGRETGEGKWNKLEMGPYDDEDPQAGLPLPRGQIATAHMGELEESGIVVWGGVGTRGQALSDGWILRLGDRA